MTTTTGRPDQLTLDDELVRLIEQRALQDRLTSTSDLPARDGACRLLRRLVQRGLSEPAVPAAAALVLALDRNVGERG
jgi:hypothetical protein